MCKETDFSGNKQSAVAQVRKKMRHTQFKMCMDCAQQLKYQMERMKRHPLHNILCVSLWERHYSRLFSLQKWGGNTLGQYSNPIIIYVEEYINMPCILTDISVTCTSIDSVTGRGRHTRTPSITHVPRWHPQ